MRIAVVVPQNGFKDETVNVAREFLLKWHVEPVIASLSVGDCRGYHGAAAKTIINIDNVRTVDFDGILLVDGPGVEQYAMYDYRPLLDAVRHFYEGGKLVAGVGNAIKILARANVIANVKIAAPKDEEARRLSILYRGILTRNGIESDRNVVTLGRQEMMNEFMSAILRELGIG